MTNASEGTGGHAWPKHKLSDYALYFQNENFHGPNDLIFDRQGDLYFTDPWGTNMANLRGAVYYVSPEGKISRLIDNGVTRGIVQERSWEAKTKLLRCACPAPQA